MVYNDLMFIEYGGPNLMRFMNGLVDCNPGEVGDWQASTIEFCEADYHQAGALLTSAPNNNYI